MAISARVIPLPSRVDGWIALVGAVERLSAAGSMENIIDIVRDVARRVSGADGVSFVLREGNLCHYVEENAVGPLWKGLRFPMSACISGWCMLNRQTAVVPDIYEDPRIPYDAYRPTFVKSLVMVPVGKEDPLAAIGFYWATMREPSESEIALLDGLGRSTAAAIAAVQAHESLRENEARLRMALSAGKLGAWELDLATGAFSASDICKTHFGRAATSAFSFDDFVRAIHPDDSVRQQTLFGLARQSGADLTVELRSLWPNGEVRWIEMRGQVILDESARPCKLAGVTLDLTEQKAARDRLAQLQSELAHSGRLSELGQMSGAFAHEVAQPLTAARFFLVAAERFMTEAPEKVPELIFKAMDQLDRGTKIVDRVRDFARTGKAERTIEQLAQLVDEAMAIALIDPKFRSVCVESSVAADLPLVQVDRVQIQQVVLNLVRNAFEAMENTASPKLAISARLDPTGTMLELRIQDNGPGIAPEIAPELFKPFVTTKSKGMGLGLSTCRDIVEGHGGKLRLDAEAAPGATFCLTLPVAHGR